MSASGAGPSSAPAEAVQPEAGPLPRKIAEFGYVAAEGERRSSDTSAPAVGAELPPHPAERSASSSRGASASHISDNAAASAGSSTSPIPPSANSSKRSKVYLTLINFLRRGSSKPIPLVWGIELPTLLRLAFTIVILVGVIVAWVLTVMFVSKQRGPSIPPGTDGTQDGSNGDLGPAPSNTDTNRSPPSAQNVIFIHTGFGILTLILLTLLERAVFIVRAERYAFKHPNAAGRRFGPRGGVALAPWSRPPLPTYANAIGFRGTGDVEDEQIAAPPPPEYGNTRDSILLLSAFLGLGSGRSQRGSGGENERPVSYRSRENVEVAIPERAASRTSRLSGFSLEEDAQRARRLEEALTALDGGEPSNVRMSPFRTLRLVRR